jgi:hypothetical protein
VVVNARRGIILRVSALSLIGAGLAALCLHAGADAAGLLCLAPAALLVIPLAVRRYPGERTILALVGARRTSRRRSTGKALGQTPSVPRAMLARGGTLLGFGLAVRPPPAPGVV